MQSLPEAGSADIVLRRRRTRRHRRNRFLRRLTLFVSLAAATAGITSITLRYLSPSLFRTSVEPDRQTQEASRNLLLLTQQESLRSMEDRPVYRYSIVPGGVRDVRELKWAADHDPVVAAHYSGFDYNHARVIRLTLGRMVYVSYRIGNNVYWSRHPIALHKGETLITDGKITGRTRCANRVEQSPQEATSNMEPPAVAFEQPLPPAIGTATEVPPVPFQSALLNRPAMPGGPGLPLLLYDPFVPGHWIPIDPPPLPGVCGVGKQKNGTGSSGNNGKKKTGNPCGPEGGGGGSVPEPGTWILVLSGLTLMYYTARYRLIRR